MKRTKALMKLDELNEICKNCTKIDDSNLWRKEKYCTTKCSVGDEFREVGRELESVTYEKAKRLLDKGQDITRSEIIYLLERGIYKKEIFKHCGIEGMRQRDYFKFMGVD